MATPRVDPLSPTPPPASIAPSASSAASTPPPSTHFDEEQETESPPLPELLIFPGHPRNDSRHRRARTRALDTSASFIVEAPAGSGKTGLLIQRYLKLLAFAEAVTRPRKKSSPSPSPAKPPPRCASASSASSPKPPQNAAPETQATSRSTAKPVPSPLAVLARDQQLGWGPPRIRPDRLHIRTIDSVCRRNRPRPPRAFRLRRRPVTPSDDAAPLYTAKPPNAPSCSSAAPTPTLHAALEHPAPPPRRQPHRRAHRLLAEHARPARSMGRARPARRPPPSPTSTSTKPWSSHGSTAPSSCAVCRALTRLTKRSSRRTSSPASAPTRRASLAHEPKATRASPSTHRHVPRPHRSRRRTAPKTSNTGAPHPPRRSPSKPAATGANVPSTPTTSASTMVPKHHKAEPKANHRRCPRQRPTLVAKRSATIVQLPPPRPLPRRQWHVAKALFRVLARALVELQFVFAAARPVRFRRARPSSPAAPSRRRPAQRRRRSSRATPPASTSSTSSSTRCRTPPPPSTSSSSSSPITGTATRKPSSSSATPSSPSTSSAKPASNASSKRMLHHTPRATQPTRYKSSTLHLTANFRSQRTRSSKPSTKTSQASSPHLRGAP